MWRCGYSILKWRGIELLACDECELRIGTRVVYPSIWDCSVRSKQICGRKRTIWAILFGLEITLDIWLLKNKQYIPYVASPALSQAQTVHRLVVQNLRALLDYSSADTASHCPPRSRGMRT